MAFRRLRFPGPGLLIAMAACAAEPVAPGSPTEAPAAGAILVSFDRLDLARGARASFRAVLVAPGGGLGTSGIVFVSRDPAIAVVDGGRGRAEVGAVAAGRTWIDVRSAASSDSVEVVVE